MVDLFSLAEDIRRCTKCPLWKGRTLAVPGMGPENAKIMLIGEAPGAEDDRQGLPFMGKSGIFLREILTRIKIQSKDIFITSCVKCRPPLNRVLRAKECTTCRDLYLSNQINCIKPKLIILVGATAVRTVLCKPSLSSIHGRLIIQNQQNYFILHHPSVALRFPKIRTMFEKDILILQQVVKTI